MKFLLESEGLPTTTLIRIDDKTLPLVSQCIFEIDYVNSKVFCEIYRNVPESSVASSNLDPLSGKFQINIIGQSKMERLSIFPVEDELKPGVNYQVTKFMADYIESKKLIIFSDDGMIIGTKIYLNGHHIPGLQRFKVIVNAGKPILIEVEQMLLPDVKDQDINVFRKEDFESPITIAKKKPE